MKNNFIKLYTAAAFLGLSATAYAQEGAVGVNTNNPKATLDVVASPNISTRIDGFIAPRLKGSELKAKDALYTADQDGTIVYVTEAVSGVTDKTTNVTSIGYYYFDKTVSTAGRWMKFNQGAGPVDVQEPWYNVATQTGATENTQNIYQMGKVGIGNNNPLSRLHLGGENTPTLTIRGEGTGNTDAYPAGRIRFLESGSSSWGIDMDFNSPAISTDPNLNTLTYRGLEGSSSFDIMTIQARGNVGIGTKTPNNKLHIVETDTTKDPAKIVGLRTGATTDQLVTVDASGNLKKILASALPNSAYQEPWLNVTDGTPATSNTAAIYQSANVGIGTTSPSARLHVNTLGHGGDEKIAYFTAPNMVDGDVSVIKFGQADSGNNNAADLRYKLTDNNDTKAFQIGFSGYQPKLSLTGKGFLGIGENAASAPTNALHVDNGNDPVRFVGLQTGTNTDEIVTVTNTGVLKKVSGTTFNAAYQEPWINQADGSLATDNLQNIYQTGSVAVGKNAVYSDAKFDVKGAVRIGDSQAGTVGVNSIASGYGNTSSGDSSSAFGVSNTASGKASFVAGTSNQATQEHSFALGNTNKAYATTSGAIGSRNEVQAGGGAMAIGVQNIIYGDYSSALGLQNIVGTNSASATASYAVGFGNKLGAAHSSYAFGANAETVYPGEIQIGNSPIPNNSPNISSITSTGYHIAFGVGANEPSAYNIKSGSNVLTIFNDGYAVIGKVNGNEDTVPFYTKHNSSDKLKVLGSVYATGSIRTSESFVSGTTTYPDYVLEEFVDGKSTLKNDYRRLTLDEVEAFIKVNKHLPGVTGIKNIEKDAKGVSYVNISELSNQTLEKVEELYLHTIEQQKQIDELKDLVKTQQEQIKALLAK